MSPISRSFPSSPWFYVEDLQRFLSHWEKHPVRFSNWVFLSFRGACHCHHLAPGCWGHEFPIENWL